MPSFSTFIATFLSASSLVAGAAVPLSQPFEHVKEKRQAQNDNGLQVDLGYEVYNGYTNQTTGLNIWRGYVTYLVTIMKCR